MHTARCVDIAEVGAAAGDIPAAYAEILIVCFT